MITITQETVECISSIMLPKEVSLKQEKVRIRLAIDYGMSRYINSQAILDELQKCLGKYSLWSEPQYSDYSVCSKIRRDTDSKEVYPMVTIKLINEEQNIYAFNVKKRKIITVNNTEEAIEALKTQF